jgi:alpha-beta hydrolase superfamily lysophospholipase
MKRIGYVSGIVAMFGLLLYSAAVTMLWARQDAFIFPQRVNALPVANPLRDGYTPLSFTAADGAKIQGLMMPATVPPSPTLVVAFAGNAHDVAGLVMYLKREVWLSPNVVVAGYVYRGYPSAIGGSEGYPSQAALLMDGQDQIKMLQAQLRPTQTLVLGYSLGTAIAAGVARDVDLQGLILVAPFTSMIDMAKAEYPWLFRPLLNVLVRHPLSTAEWVQAQKAPVWLASAEADGLIPREHFAKVVAAAEGKRKGAIVIQGATHSSVLEDPHLKKWLQEALPQL